MRHEEEFTYIVSVVNEYLSNLPDGPVRVAVTRHAVGCLTVIEMELRDGVEPSGANVEQV